MRLLVLLGTPFEGSAFCAAAGPPHPSPETVQRSIHAAQVAQTLLQRQQISLGEALSLQLPLCVPVSIGQVRQCVPVLYDSGAPTPQPQPTTAPPETGPSFWEAPGVSASLKCSCDTPEELCESFEAQAG